VARRKALHAKGGLGRYSPPTRGRGTHAAGIPASNRHHLRPAVSLVGTGLLATTGFLGLGVLGASPGGAVVGVECLGTTSLADSVGNTCLSAAGAAQSGFGNTDATSTIGNTSSGTSGGTAYSGSQNTGFEQTSNDNSAIANGTGAQAFAGSYGVGSKTSNNNSAVANGTGAYAAAGSYGIGSKSTTSSDTATATGTASYAYSGFHDNGTTADNDTATATSGGIAYSGSNDLSTTDDNDSAVAIGLGASAYSATSDPDLTANGESTFAQAANGGTALSTATGNGGFDWTYSNGSTAVASANTTPVSATATSSAGPTSIAFSISQNGLVSASADGTTIYQGLNSEWVALPARLFVRRPRSVVWSSRNWLDGDPAGPPARLSWCFTRESVPLARGFASR